MSTARVLVVDDEPVVLDMVSRALSRRGYAIHAASTPSEALELVKAEARFDLVVSDVIMPDMCGPELVKKITQICPDAAVVLMSGHIDAASLPKRTAFISKPFLLRDLYSVVDKALAGWGRASDGA